MTEYKGHNHGEYDDECPICYLDKEIERLTEINKHQFEDCADQVAQIDTLTAENRKLREAAIEATGRWFAGLAVGASFQRLKDLVSTRQCQHKSTTSYRDGLEECDECGERVDTQQKRESLDVDDARQGPKCDDCGRPSEYIGPDTFGGEYHCPECDSYWAQST